MNLFRRHLAGHDPGVVKEAELLVLDHVFAAVGGQLDIESLRLAEAGEIRTERGEQFRQRRAGEAEQAERLGFAASLHQPELTALAEAFKAHHQIANSGCCRPGPCGRSVGRQRRRRYRFGLRDRWRLFGRAPIDLQQFEPLDREAEPAHI